MNFQLHMKLFLPISIISVLILSAGFSIALPEAAPVEKDPRVQSQGKTWGLYQAAINDPKMPRVLLVGDSILNCYRGFVIKALDGKAAVDVWLNPYCQSEKYNQQLAEILDKGPYDIVHINVGLHGFQEGRIKEGTFEPLTQKFIEILRQKNPKVVIIWANTTPVTRKDKPGELDPVINSTILQHNQMAAKVMMNMNVPTNDFYGLLIDHLDLAKGDQFHWKAPAYKILGDAASAAILPQLALITRNSQPAMSQPKN